MRKNGFKINPEKEQGVLRQVRDYMEEHQKNATSDLFADVDPYYKVAQKVLDEFVRKEKQNQLIAARHILVVHKVRGEMNILAPTHSMSKAGIDIMRKVELRQDSHLAAVSAEFNDKLVPLIPSPVRGKFDKVLAGNRERNLTANALHL